MNKLISRFRTILLCSVAILFTTFAYAQPDSDVRTPQKDQQILDDLIVDGSACIGQDCVNGESFGFDTLRLKENNLRIKAQDTSSTVSFPTQDWQITFNDSSNGGANKFSIDAISPSSSTPFTIEAGAPSHSLYVEDGGRIGFGTSTPVVDLHVKSGNTPTLRLEQDGSSGFTAQTWDVAGNEANFFIRDASNGSTLPFRIEPGAPSNALYVNNDGTIGLGTSNPETTPQRKLHIQTAGAVYPLVRSSNNAAGIEFQADNGDHQFRMFAAVNNAFNLLRVTDSYYPMAIDAQGEFAIGGNLNAGADFEISPDGVTYSRINAGDMGVTGTSSKSLKKNIKKVEVENVLDRIANVAVNTYDYKMAEKARNPEKYQNKLGLIAEEFHTVFERGSDKEINSQEVDMALWLAVQELTAKGKNYEQLLEEKDNRINDLESRLTSLENVIAKLNLEEINLNHTESLGYLDQNIPNPFDGETRINYFVPQEAFNAEIQFTDMSGKLIRKLDIRDKGQGMLSVKAGELPQGTYNYSLIIDGKIIQTKKMVLAR